MQLTEAISFITSSVVIGSIIALEYLVTFNSVASTVNSEPMYSNYSLGSIVTTKLYKQQIGFDEASNVVAERMFAMDVGVQVGRVQVGHRLTGGVKRHQLTVAEYSNQIKVSRFMC